MKNNNILLLLLISVGLLSTLTISCKKDKSAGYSCINGNCASVDNNAEFSTLSDCQSNNSCGGGNADGGCNGAKTITDPRDGQTYAIVQIGNQCWFAENLRYSGSIPEVTEEADWYAIFNNYNSTQQPAWCYYDNNPANDAVYGKLYNGYAVLTGTLCPSGWRIPNYDDWTSLLNHLTSNTVGFTNNGQNIAGGKMKSVGTQHWQSPNKDATNESGFSGMPGGMRLVGGEFERMGTNGRWWGTRSATSNFGASVAHGYYLWYNDGSLYGNQGSNYHFGQSCRCVKGEPDNNTGGGGIPGAPILTTIPISDITLTTAISGGIISSEGDAAVTQRGVCFSTTPNPTTSNFNIVSGSGSGSFSSELIGLSTNTTYYVRAFAINSIGTSYGNQISFKTEGLTSPGAGVTFNGYTYKTLLVGNGQEWMAENLRTNAYANGDPIPHLTSDSMWSVSTTGAWRHLNNNSSYDNPYGKLYKWSTVTDSRNVCPTGWHVPTDQEWNLLIGYFDSTHKPNASGSNQSQTAGGKMKSIGTQYWNSPNTSATNETGFSALPSGMVLPDGFSSTIGQYVIWWSTTESNAINAWTRTIFFNDASIQRSYYHKGMGLSIRCLKD